MKSRITAAILAFTIGGIGIHRFYLGKTVSGLLRLMFAWTFIPSLMAMYDFAVLVGMSDEDFNKKFN